MNISKGWTFPIEKKRGVEKNFLLYYYYYDRRKRDEWTKQKKNWEKDKICVYEEIVVINLSIKILNFFLLLLLHHWARSRVNWLPFYIKFIFVKKTHAEILLVVVLAWRLCVRWHLKNNKKNFNDDDDDDDVVGKLKFFFSFGGKRKKVMK